MPSLQHCALLHSTLEVGSEATFGGCAEYRRQLEHLKGEHLEYFIRWERMISLEEGVGERDGGELFALRGKEREAMGRCFAGMELAGVEEGERDGFATVLHTFRRSPAAEDEDARSPPPPSLLDSSISLGDLLTISTEPSPCGSLPPRWGISRGKPSHHRRLIVDLAPPSFQAAEPLLSSLPSLTRAQIDRLNPEQLHALERIVSARDYALVQGMPGTGKTTLIAHAASALSSLGGCVLLCAYTHAALDHTLLKLIQMGTPFLRLGAAVRCNHGYPQAASNQGQEECREMGGEGPTNLARAR
ncbi:MAG: hypothetical protein SGPRY_012797 [Prymnesium sp.]